MANLDEMLKYVQHSYVNGLYKKGSKYDIASDLGFADFLYDNLWYTYNNASFQIPYSINVSLYPQCYIDKTFDLMYAWRLAMLLNVDHARFIICKIKINTIAEINSIIDFDIKNFLVLFYDASQPNHYSLIFKFLSSFRNALAHGAFNKIHGSYNNSEVYLSADSYDDSTTKGVQLGMRLFDDDNDDKSSVRRLYIALNDITNNQYDDIYSLFDSNLILSGYQLLNKSTYQYHDNEFKNNVRTYILKKGELYKQLFYIENSSASDICHIVSLIVVELFKNNDDYFTNTIFYLANCHPNISKSKIENECIQKIRQVTSNDIDSLPLDIKTKEECYTI